MTTLNPLTPHEVHTLREIIREQEHAARSNGRELAGPWLIIKRLLAERDEDRDRICELQEEIDCIRLSRGY